MAYIIITGRRLEPRKNAALFLIVTFGPPLSRLVSYCHVLAGTSNRVKGSNKQALTWSPEVYEDPEEPRKRRSIGHYKETCAERATRVTLRSGVYIWYHWYRGQTCPIALRELSVRECFTAARRAPPGRGRGATTLYGRTDVRRLRPANGAPCALDRDGTRRGRKIMVDAPR